MKMKLNKKRWTILGVILAIVAIIPATAMIVTSCSNSNTTNNPSAPEAPKDTTSFHTNVTASGNDALLRPNDLQVEDKLKTFILTNVIYDFKNNITTSNITIIESIPNLASGTLNVKYTVSNTYVSGIVQENAVDKNVTISGLAVWNTDFVENPNEPPPSGFEAYLPSAIIKFTEIHSINALQSFVYENALSGIKTDIVRTTDIEIDLANSVANDTMGTLDLKYTIKKYWVKSELQTANPLAKTVKISGLKKS